MGMRSGTVPRVPNGCDAVNLDRSWFGIEVGRGPAEVVKGSAVKVSDGVETVSVKSSGVGAAHVPEFLDECPSSRLFGVLLASLADDRDSSCAGNVFARCIDVSAGAGWPLVSFGLLDGAERLRLAGAFEPCRFFSISGRFLKTPWITVSLLC